ncbi:hypothetical protein [Parabacteroides johnsonii]|jgi:putative uncharacterized protein (fragment)|uniref:hypothetical protein n=1 Tax=Parabacteroides johnsonii TaxID=387661 RepID=UPI00266BBEF3|nr:hypothetical protein [Parabacteroides johnsonii]
MKNTNFLLLLFFTLPELKWKFAAGIPGQGPQDFYQLERRLFLPTEKGFKIFSQPDRKLKEVWIQDSTLWIDNEHAVEFDIDEIPANGVLPLNDTSIIYWGGMDSDAEYLSLDSHSTPKELTPTQTGIRPITKKSQSSNT